MPAERSPVEDDAASAGSVAAAGSSTATILVAGDIASCAWRADSRTADPVDSLAGTVMTAGDNAYDTGTDREFRDCYGPTWGRFRDRTRPTPGNHDWVTPGAGGYFRYFDERAGPAGRGYHAFDAGSWRVYSLSSDCGYVGGCAKGSEQHTWLKQQLASHPNACVLAVWHQPRFSSGPLPVSGDTFRDAGSGTCHGKPPR